MRHAAIEQAAMYETHLQPAHSIAATGFIDFSITRARCNVLGLYRSHPPCGQLPRRSGQSGPDRHFLQATSRTPPSAHRARRSSFLSLLSIH